MIRTLFNVGNRLNEVKHGKGILQGNKVAGLLSKRTHLVFSSLRSTCSGGRKEF